MGFNGRYLFCRIDPAQRDALTATVRAFHETSGAVFASEGALDPSARRADPHLLGVVVSAPVSVDGDSWVAIADSEGGAELPLARHLADALGTIVVQSDVADVANAPEVVQVFGAAPSRTFHGLHHHLGFDYAHLAERPGAWLAVFRVVDPFDRPEVITSEEDIAF